MQKQREMNHELIRRRFIEIFEKYIKTKGKSTTEMQEVVKEYDDVVEMLDETLNCSIGIMDALAKDTIKDKKEKDTIVKEILEELKQKDYLKI